MDQANEDAALWLRYSKEDLKTAQSLVRTTEIVARHPAWLAQQAAEKAVKAILIADKTRFPRTHDLDSLISILPSEWQVYRETLDLDRLTEFAVEARYPGDLADVSLEDAQAAVEDAATLVAAVEADLKKRLDK